MIEPSIPAAVLRPGVFIAVSDRASRHAIVDALHRQGWAARELSTGFHVIEALADVIEGRPGPAPAFVVIDALARGCSGVTIARGLRELAIEIPVLLVARPGDPIDSDVADVHVVPAGNAAAAIAERARAWSPLSAAERRRGPERASA